MPAATRLSQTDPIYIIQLTGDQQTIAAHLASLGTNGVLLLVHAADEVSTTSLQHLESDCWGPRPADISPRLLSFLSVSSFLPPKVELTPRDRRHVRHYQYPRLALEDTCIS
jgi:hypothetical protein